MRDFSLIDLSKNLDLLQFSERHLWHMVRDRLRIVCYPNHFGIWGWLDQDYSPVFCRHGVIKAIIGWFFQIYRALSNEFAFRGLFLLKTFYELFRRILWNVIAIWWAKLRLRIVAQTLYRRALTVEIELGGIRDIKRELYKSSNLLQIAQDALIRSWDCRVTDSILNLFPANRWLDQVYRELDVNLSLWRHTPDVDFFNNFYVALRIIWTISLQN